MTEIEHSLIMRKHRELLTFIENNNSVIKFGVVFNITDGKKHLLWCGSFEKPMLRITLKPK